MNKFDLFLQGKGISKDDLKAKTAEDLAGIYNEYSEKRDQADGRRE